MSLIVHGSPSTFSAAFRQAERQSRPSLEGLKDLASVCQATRGVQAAPLEFGISPTPRGLALKSLKLMKGFEGFLQGIFNPKNEVYFLAWAWDLSGEPPIQYPGPDAPPASCLIPLKSGELREFLGDGVLLFPARKVTAGLALRIQIWECDRDIVRFGKALSSVADTIKNSELSSLLSLISTAGGVTTATVSLVTQAALQLAGVIGKILESNSDDYVDYYEGYYSVSNQWTPGVERHGGHASEVALTRL